MPVQNCLKCLTCVLLSAYVGGCSDCKNMQGTIGIKFFSKCFMSKYKTSFLIAAVSKLFLILYFFQTVAPVVTIAVCHQADP